MVSLKNQALLHIMLVGRLSETDRIGGYMDEMHNSVEVVNPFTVLDCTPDKDYDNFEHFMKDRVLVYAEVANTTPVGDNGYTVLCDKLPSLRARTTGVLTDENIVKMRDSLVGTMVYPYHMIIPSLSRGVFIESWLMDEYAFGFPTKILCGLAWMEKSYFDTFALPNRVAYLAFGMHVDYETCCKCGNTYTDDKRQRCKHMESRLENTVFGFDRYTGFSLEN